MHELYELKEKLCEELEDYNEKELSKTNLDVMEKLAVTIKSLGKIIEMYDEEEGYSSMGGSYAQGRGGSRGGNRGGNRGGRSNRSYEGGSYARNGRRRDLMGRYSREGYSRGDEMIAELRELMEDAPDEKTRKEFERFISKVENM